MNIDLPNLILGGVLLVCLWIFLQWLFKKFNLEPELITIFRILFAVFVIGWLLGALGIWTSSPFLLRIHS